MLTCSNEFAKGFLWKYVDITINKAEYTFLKNNTRYNTDFENLFNKFRHVFSESTDLYNYLFVVSIIEPFLFKSFLVFYSTNIQRFYNNIHYKKLASTEELIAYIGCDENKFKLLLISLYYYF